MKRHEIDIVSLVSGLLFTTLAVVFTLNALGTVTFDIRVVPATVLIVLGIAGVSASIQRTARTPPTTSELVPVPELELEPVPLPVPEQESE